MNLLRLITLPYVRRHRFRTLLTVAGIALGVAIFIAIHAANQSVLHGFQSTVQQIAGRTQLQITAGDAGLAEELLDRVREVPGVRSAAPVIEAVAQTGLGGEGNLLILAVDLVGDGALRDYDMEGDEEIVRDPLEFLAQPDSLIVTRDFAARTGRGIGSTLPMQTMDGEKRFTIRGLLRAGGMSSAFGGNLAVMDIYAAQKVLGRGRTFDRIDVVAAEGELVTDVQARLQQALGPAFAVESPERRSEHFGALLAGYSTLTNSTSVFALMISLFVIYNSFAIAVVERRSQIGILRALGATRGQIRALFLSESAIAGVAGAMLGILVGLGAVDWLARRTAGLAAGLSGRIDASDEILITNELLLLAAAVGVITSMVAAWLPARSAARVDPVRALQKGKYQALTTGDDRRRRFLSFGIISVSIVCVLTGSTTLFYFGYGLFVMAVVLLAPTLCLLLARGLRFPLKLFRPVEGALAADSLIQAPRRTSATVTGLMLSLAMVIAMAGIARAARHSIEEWVTTVFNSDVLLSTSEGINPGSFHFPASMESDLEGMAEVAAVQAVRAIRAPIDGWPVMIVGIEMLKSAGLNRGRRAVAGDFDQMHRLAGEGRGVIVTENLAILRNLRMGDMMDLPAPTGVLRMPIVGIFRDYANQTGALYMDLALFRRGWQDDTIDLIHVYLRPGVAPEEAKQRILARFQGNRRLFVLLNREVREYVGHVTDQWFGLTYFQLGVAVLVAVLGIVNALTVSIVDRKRELGVLRAVGAVRNQIRQAVQLEAVAIGVMGGVLGLAFGAVNLYYQLEAVRRSAIALPLDYEFPGVVALGLFPMMLLVAWISALGPAEAAVRGSLVEALEYE